jgi:hypothetical protein
LTLADGRYTGKDFSDGVKESLPNGSSGSKKQRMTQI